MLGEAHMIRCNLQWEQTRYLAAMLYNVNCQKRSQMLKPEKLFPLPQDALLERGKPKSTVEQYIEFKKKTEDRHWETLD